MDELILSAEETEEQEKLVKDHSALMRALRDLSKRSDEMIFKIEVEKHRRLTISHK